MSETDTTNDGAIQSLLKRATQLWWRCEAALERIERRVQTIMANAQEHTGTGIARTDNNCTDNSVSGSETAHVNNNRIDIKVDANALAIISLVLSVAAVVYVMTHDQTVDAKIASSASDLRASVQQQIADARATAQAGKEHARIALDEVQRSNAQLEAKGLIRPANH